MREARFVNLNKEKWSRMERMDHLDADTLAENYVMQALTANERRMFYWMPETNASRGEIDFVVQTERAEVVPIEVKSGRNIAAKSLKRFIGEAGSPYAIRLSEQQFSVTPVEGSSCVLRGVPLYAAFCL